MQEHTSQWNRICNKMREMEQEREKNGGIKAEKNQKQRKRDE